GKHTLKYHSVDMAGNVEESHTHEFQTDDKAPVTAINYSGHIIDFSDIALVGPDFSIQLSSNDEKGAKTETTSFQVRTDRSPASTAYNAYEGPIKLAGDGLRTIAVRSVDRVGNQE